MGKQKQENAEKKTDREKKARTKKLRKQYTAQFYKGNRILFMATMVLSLLAGTITTVIARLLQLVMDVASGTTDTALSDTILMTGLIVIYFMAIMLLYRAAKPRYIERAMRQYKEFAFGKLTKKSIGSFSKEDTGKYISALTNDALQIQEKYVSNVFDFVEMSIAFVASLALMLFYSPLLTAIGVVLMLLPMIVSIAAGNRLAAKEEIISKKNEGFVGMIKDLLTGFTVIKSFQSEKEAAKLFMEENSGLERARRERIQTALTINMLSQTAGIVAQFGVFLVGAYLAIRGDITSGVVIAFVQLMGGLLSPIAQVPQLLGNRKAAKALMDKLATALEENVKSVGGEELTDIGNGIRIDNLSFEYEENKPVLKDICATFETGKSYAVVGGSGSGKSTMLNLLMGSADNYDGEIHYDGKELREISPESLYGMLTMVQQNVFVFNDTIRNNVTMFKEFPDDKVALAMKKSGLSELIAAKGEDYVCGENGNALSGGEKQRISIARALLSEAPVLLMDEATAALDAATAFEITNAILKVDDMTRIVVTHRLEEALLRQYDEILVMRGGQICEKGSFEELMEQKDLFYSLYTVAQCA